MLYADESFSKKFCRQTIAELVAAIAKHGVINLVAMPGLGVTFLIRQLAYCSSDQFVFVNSFEMHEFTKSVLYNQLARKLGLESASSEHIDLQIIGEALSKQASSGHKLVLVFNRFDRLGPILDQQFYENLHFLRHVTGDKLTLLLVTEHALIEQSSSHEAQELLQLIDDTRYFKGYSLEDLREILTTSGVKDIEEQALALSGGHHVLAQILMRCQNLDNALSDPMVELIIKDLYLGLSPKRRKVIDALAAGHAKQIDPFLLHTGYVTERGDSYAPFTPLLTAYAQRQSREHLPLRERRLLSILKRNVGHVVSKQEVFDAVWRDTNGIASEWALNALVYRLRRHPAFDNQNYTIESHKKQGYLLRRHQS